MRAFILTIATLVVASAGCVAPTVIPSATPTSPGASVHTLVLGRIQVSVGGQAARVGREGRGARAGGGEWTGSPSWDQPPAGASGPDTLTKLVFHNARRNEKFVYEIEDDSGRFEILLPRGPYTVQLWYDKWRQNTPAEFEVADEGGRYYVGTLRVDLFRHRSLRSVFVRAFGGTVPPKDTEFRVVDEWGWAQENLRSLADGSAGVDKRLMRLRGTP